MTEIALPDDEPSTVGQTLKASRLAQGLTIEQVSEILCISKRHLALLENDENHLIYDVYTLGFIKLYAQHLNLNVQDITQRFKKQNTDSLESPQKAFPAPLPGRGMPSTSILVFSLLVLVSLILGWKWLNHDTLIPPPPEFALEPVSSSQPETPPTEEQVSSEDPSTTPLSTTSTLKGDYPLFEERAYPSPTPTEIQNRFEITE